MKQLHVFSCAISFFLLSVFSSLVMANRTNDNDIETIFNWAEQSYPNLFSPSGAQTQFLVSFNEHSWLYRYYIDTETYAGINDQGKAFVYGNKFGGLKYIDTRPSLLSLVNKSEGNEGNGNCVNIPLIANERKLTFRISFSPPGLGEAEIDYEQLIETYSEVTETLEKKSSVIISKDTKIDRTTDVETQYTIKNNYAEISQITTQLRGGESISDSLYQHEYSPIQYIYSPAKRKPVKVFCENQTWNSTYDETIIGEQIQYSQANRGEVIGVVEAINIPITTASGTYNTVRIRKNFKRTEEAIGKTYSRSSLTWVSIDYGVIVYKDFSDGEITHELTALE